MEKYILFIEKLNNLYRETGIYIETFRDNFYDPYLAHEEDDSRDIRVYITFDIETDRYVGLLNNPYNGELISI